MRKIPVYAFFPNESLSTAEDAERRKVRNTQFVIQPLAIAMVIESARLHDSGRLQQIYDFSPGLFSSLPDLLAAAEKYGPGPCLFSNYVWSIKESILASRRLKEVSPECITIHGGPSTPKYPDACAKFLNEHAHVDVAVRGEGEATVFHLLDALVPTFQARAGAVLDTLAEVSGLTFVRRQDGKVIRTPERPLIQDLDSIPSPYLTGFFDKSGWSPVDRGYAFMTLETNRGCPYGCTFCDWGSATLQKIRNFSLERVRAEFEWIASRRIERVFVADANFGIFPRDLEIAKLIAEVKERYGYPLIVTTNYAKNGADRLPEIFRIWKSAGITFDPVVSIQTTDEETLRVIRRSNIKTHKYVELSNAYREMKLPFTIQLMMGLPGSSIESWKRDLQFYFERLEDVQMFTTQLLPNSPMASPDYMMEHAIETDERGMIVACKSFSRADYEIMGSIGIVFALFSHWALLRWYLLYLQWEYRIRALDFMHEVALAVWRRSPEYPELVAIFGPLFESGFGLFSGSRVPRFEHYYTKEGWETFYAELLRFTTERYNIATEQGLNTAIQVQLALRPVKGAVMPREVPLAHDFVAYVQDGMEKVYAAGGMVSEAAKSLSQYGPATLVVTDPFGLCLDKDTHNLPTANEPHPGWELQSRLRDIEPSPEFLAARLLKERKQKLNVIVAESAR